MLDRLINIKPVSLLLNNNIEMNTTNVPNAPIKQKSGNRMVELKLMPLTFDRNEMISMEEMENPPAVPVKDPPKDRGLIENSKILIENKNILNAPIKQKSKEKQFELNHRIPFNLQIDPIPPNAPIKRRKIANENRNYHKIPPFNLEQDVV